MEVKTTEEFQRKKTAALNLLKRPSKNLCFQTAFFNFK